MTTAKSRWFRFSLRTMLVAMALVAFAIWFGVEMKFVHERQAWIHLNKKLIRPAEPRPVGSTAVEYIYAHRRSSYFPFWRKWLGDAPVASIVFPEGPVWIELEGAKRLFPEADLHHVSAVMPTPQEKIGGFLRLVPF